MKIINTLFSKLANMNLMKAYSDNGHFGCNLSFNNPTNQHLYLSQDMMRHHTEVIH